MGTSADYWNERLERNALRSPPHGRGPDSDAGAFLAWQLEAAGDIICEADKGQYADRNYIFEKYNRLKNHLKERDWGDPLSAREQQALIKIKSDIVGLPADTALTKQMKIILGAVAYRNPEEIQANLQGLRITIDGDLIAHQLDVFYNGPWWNDDGSLLGQTFTDKEVTGSTFVCDNLENCRQKLRKLREQFQLENIGRYDNMVQHLGYNPSELDEDQKVKLIQESQRRLAGVKPIRDSDLTPAQLSTLNLARCITKQKVYAANIPPASDRVTTAGMYSRSNREIYISPSQLERGREAVSTTIHELAHHTSGSEDGEPEHAAEISNLANQVVAATKRGDFDRYLSGAFTW